MQETDPKDLIQSYLDAFAARDLARCVEFYSDDAKIYFPPATYQGRQSLESWHQGRFDANAQLIRLDGIAVNGDVVTVQGAISSKRLKAWRLGSLSGRAAFKLHDGKIVELRFEMPSWNSFLGRGAPTDEVFRT